MIVPRICIQRHDAGVYKWALLIDDESLYGEVGETSIEACLKSALFVFPLDVRQVDIEYRGMSVGTVSVEELAERPDLVAERIAEGYAAMF